MMNNKKIIAYLFSSIIVISVLAGIVFISYQPASQSSPPNTISHYIIGAKNSGLTVPIYDIGFRGKNGTSIMPNSFGSDLTITNGGSVYYVSGHTLIINSTITLRNVYIPYNLEIQPGAILTLGYGVILNEKAYGNNQGYNNYTAGQLIISHSLIETNQRYGDNREYITAYINNSLIIGKVNINVIEGNNDTFRNSNINIIGNVSNSQFMYNCSLVPLHIKAYDNNAIIKYSYFDGVDISLNDGNYLLHIQHSTLSIKPEYASMYVDSGVIGSRPFQPSEIYVNLSYDKFISFNGPQYEGAMLFIYSDMYDDFANFTVPQKDWNNITVIDDARDDAMYDKWNPVRSRSITSINDSQHPVVISHNDFSGLSGINIYGIGHAYIKNNIITEQDFATAYIGAFVEHHEPLVNSTFSNNTFYFYGNQSLEKLIHPSSGGGPTYITGGEKGNVLENVSIEYNTFQGPLFTINNDYCDAHPSYILGPFPIIKYNFFNITSTFNTVSAPAFPEFAIDGYAFNSIINISYNTFAGLQNDTVAISFGPIGNSADYDKGVGNYSTIDLYENEFEGQSVYDVVAYQYYTVHAILQANSPNLMINGTAIMYHSGTTYNATSYSIEPSNLIIKEVKKYEKYE